MAVTFLNYEFPDEWMTTTPVRPREYDWLADNVVDPCRARVVLVDRGPAEHHIIVTEDYHA